MSSDHAFSGSVPENYHRYLVPMIFVDYARELTERACPPAGGAVLETACGTGVVTRQLLDRLPPDGTIVATDLQAPMIDFTGAELDDARLTLRAADAVELPFEHDTFDAVVSGFGAMFFPDRVRAYGEALRVLKPGGVFAASIWDSLAHNDFARLAHELLLELFPDDPPEFLSIPYGYHDLSVLKADLEEAGFDEIEILVQKRLCTCPRAGDVPSGFLRGSPAIHEILARTDDVDAVTDALARRVTELYGATDCRGNIQAYIVTARRRL
jgi:SAM-dependent methyltransferase